jgi:hypothetical protein
VVATLVGGDDPVLPLLASLTMVLALPAERKTLAGTPSPRTGPGEVIADRSSWSRRIGSAQ